MAVDFLGFAYAATVAAGGIMGYAKAGSVTSLASGLVFGSLLGLGAYQITQDPSNYTVMLGTSSALGGIMGHRYYKSGKIMPAGLVFFLSLGMIAKIAFKNIGASPPLAVKTGTKQ